MWLFDLFKQKKKPELKLVPPIIETPKTTEPTITQPKTTEMPDLSPKVEVPNPGLSNPKTATSVSAKGVEFLFHGEGFRKKPYLDTKGVPTIGFGTTYYPDGKRVTMADKEITRDEALALAMHHIKNEVETPINKLIKVKLNQNQYDAVVSLVYNIGIGGFSTSTVLKKLNIGDYEGACQAFMLWNKSGGQPILTSRRQKEMDLFKSTV